MKPIFLIIFLLLSVVNLSAEDLPLIEPGTRVRVFAPSYATDWLIGTFIALDANTLSLKPETRTFSSDADTLVVLSDTKTALVIPLAAVKRLEVNRGRGILGERWKLVPLLPIGQEQVDLQESPEVPLSELATQPFSVENFGLWKIAMGYGSKGAVRNEENPEQDRISVSMELFSLMLRLNFLRGLGIKTALLDFSTNFSVSPMPLYLYYPLYQKEKEIESRYGTAKVRSPYIYLFAGGSAWGQAQEYENGSCEYAHAGISAKLYVSSSSGGSGSLAETIETRVPAIHFGIQSGVAHYKDKKSQNYSVYVTFFVDLWNSR